MTTNWRHDAALEKGKEIFGRSKAALESKAVPFGRKLSSRAQWRVRVQADEAFRAAEVARMGVKPFLQMWKKESGK